MMQVVVNEESLYPVYTLAPRIFATDETIEIPVMLYDRYTTVMKQFKSVQNEIRQFQLEQEDDEEYDSAPERIKVGKYRD
jgi:hypothetical protein